MMTESVGGFLASLRALHLEREENKRREIRRQKMFEKEKLIFLWFVGGFKKRNKAAWSLAVLVGMNIS